MAGSWRDGEGWALTGMAGQGRLDTDMDDWKGMARQRWLDKGRLDTDRDG
jgi:hypothetical protein